MKRTLFNKLMDVGIVLFVVVMLALLGGIWVRALG